MSTNVVVSLLDHPRVMCQPRASLVRSNLSAQEFALLRPADLVPLHQAPRRRSANSLEGLWWFASTKQHVGFASLAERDALTVLDFSGEVRDIVRDPLVVLPARHSGHSLPCPLLFIRDASGSCILIVRGSVDDAAKLRDVFPSTSVQVATLEPVPASTLRTVKWLAGYRFSRFRMSAEAEHKIFTLCAIARPIGVVAAALASEIGSEVAVRACIYALIWHHLLSLEESTPHLSDRCMVVAR